ncbi:solute carrier family 22 member 21 [Plakobranchus ocellatus]|uniref:Solute carrier family 22 member 21 n=1 Tax=Plakobranchus ocellatus TaxID=259542 RepID=A0AAV3ZT55_9GAST|nr:solute carrier family 22 member 21 [Plakobranchus ocellatus]
MSYHKLSTIEDIYDQIGGLGRFQLAAMFLVAGLKFPLGWSMMLMSYAGYIGDFVCITDVEMDHTMLTNISASGQTVNGSALNACSVNGTACTDFKFLGSKRTAISEWHLVCDRRWLKATITSIQLAGVIPGTFLGGLSGDYIGRRYTTYGSLLLHVIMNVISAYSVTWQMFVVMRFLLGTIMGILLIMIVPYPAEFLPTRWRHVAPAIPFWPMGVTAFAGVAWWLEDWSLIQHGCAIASAVIIIPESPRWLATQGRLEESYKVLEKMARMNGKTLPPAAMDVVRKIAEEEKAIAKKKKYTYWDLFKGKRSCFITIVFSLQWVVMAIIYYGISFGVNSFVGNLYLNIFLMNAVQFFGYLFTALVINRMGRRPTSVFLMAVLLAISLACVSLQKAVSEPTRGRWISGLCQFATVVILACWSASQVWITESYPTVIRSLSYGFVMLSARIGSTLAPFVVNLDEMPLLSFVLMSIIALVSMVTILFLPETSNQVMQESVGRSTGKTKVENADGLTPEDIDNIEGNSGEGESMLTRAGVVNTAGINPDV